VISLKKLTVLVAVAAVAVSSFGVSSADAAKKKKKPKQRVFKTTYTCPCGVQVLGIGQGFRLGSGEGGVQIVTSPKEKFITFQLTDDSGQPVYFSLTQNLEGEDNLYETDVGDGCGKTTEPLSIPQPGADIIAFIYSGTCDTGVGLATGGKAKAVLSARP
jgi:hypothetical protein